VEVGLLEVDRRLCDEVEGLSFGPPVHYVYNPLRYARVPHESYLGRFGQGTKQVLLLGMNPGPFGMAQTGVPFGDVAMVRDWLGIDGEVEPPPHEHPSRRVLGFSCPRSEVSGSRLWGWARRRFSTPERFFERFFVINYCPLAFLEESGRNRTPDKLPVSERQPLFAACDRALCAAVDLLSPELVIGVGTFALDAAKRALAERGVRLASMLHPSPASPRANRGWEDLAERDLEAAGVTL
jgi:single-strand selective monofunctional uracil DNA glycosylase